MCREDGRQRSILTVEEITEDVSAPTISPPPAQPGLAIFNSPEFGDIRTVMEDGKPLFCAKDVAVALGHTNPERAIRKFCKGVTEMVTPSTGGPQKISFIPESDVYRLVMRSKLPGAERFQDWVVEEVLPTIRKTGKFEIAPAIPQDMGEALQLAANLWKQNSAQAQQQQIQTRELAVKDAQLEAAAPKVEFYEKFASADGCFGVRKASQALDIPGRKSCEVARVALCLSGCSAPGGFLKSRKPPPPSHRGGVLISSPGLSESKD